MVRSSPSVLLLWNADWNRSWDSTGRNGYYTARKTSFGVQLNEFFMRSKLDGFVWTILSDVRHSLDGVKMSQGCITTVEEIQSWWEVPAIAHFCSLFRTAFNLPDFEIEVICLERINLRICFIFVGFMCTRPFSVVVATTTNSSWPCSPVSRPCSPDSRSRLATVIHTITD